MSSIIEVTSKQTCAHDNTRDPLQSKTDLVTIKCQHRSLLKGMTFFEVVPDTTFASSYKDKLTLNWVGPNKPQVINVSNLGSIKETKGNFEIELSTNFFEEKWKATRADLSNYLLLNLSIDVLRQFWTVNHKKTFMICGLPNGSLPVTLYNPEKWKLEISFPEYNQYKNGKKYEGKTIGKWDKPDAKQIQEEKDKESTKGQQAIKLSRNGNALQFSGIDIIHNFLRIIKLFESVQELLKSTPKVGWYLEWDFQLFKGSVALEWGWEEYTKQDVPSKDEVKTNEAVYKVKLDAKSKIIDAKIELGFGVKAAGFGVQVFVAFKGEVSLSLVQEKISPNKNLDFNIRSEILGKISGVGGARVELGFIYKVEFTVESGFEIKGSTSISISTGFVVQASVGWTGVSGKVTQSSEIGATFGEKSKSTKFSSQNEDSEFNNGAHIFIKPKEFGSYEFPSSSKPEDFTIGNDEIKEIIKSMLLGDLIKGGRIDKQNPKGELKFTWNKKSGIWTYDFEYISLDIISNILLNEIISNKKVVKRRKTIEGIAIWVRLELEKLIIEEFTSLDYIWYEDVKKFVSNKMKPYLITVQDPLL